MEYICKNMDNASIFTVIADFLRPPMPAYNILNTSGIRATADMRADLV